MSQLEKAPKVSQAERVKPKSALKNLHKKALLIGWGALAIPGGWLGFSYDQDQQAEQNIRLTEEAARLQACADATEDLPRALSDSHLLRLSKIPENVIDKCEIDVVADDNDSEDTPSTNQLGVTAKYFDDPLISIPTRKALSDSAKTRLAQAESTDPSNIYILGGAAAGLLVGGAALVAAGAVAAIKESLDQK